MGATVNLYTRNTTTPVLATTTTDANGLWTISYATEGRYDIETVSGSNKRRRKWDTQTQMSALEVATFRIRNPAFTFDYDVVPAAITADRQLNLPLITATDTLPTLGLAQTWTGVQTLESPVLVTPALGTPASGTMTNVTGLPTAGMADGAVTLAKMANLAQDLFIGRTTASTGVPETATITAAARTALDDTTVAAMVDTLGGAAATGSGGLVRATSPTLTTPNISQVVFPATQVASAGANTLDDYEEGTWTPTLMDNTYDGTGEGQVYTTQNGRYLKIGRNVFIEGELEVSSIGTLAATDTASIGGLPFTVNATLYGVILIGYADSLAITANQSVTGLLVLNSTRIDLYVWNAATGTGGTLAISGYSAGGRVIFTAFYSV